jgi:muramidase (phage lysozyme)
MNEDLLNQFFLAAGGDPNNKDDFNNFKGEFSSNDGFRQEIFKVAGGDIKNKKDYNDFLSAVGVSSTPIADVSSIKLTNKQNAFLDAIAEVESNNDYNVIVGGGKFDDMSDHPRKVGVRTEYGNSTAAGAFQITASTWDSLQNTVKFPDFSPKSQKVAAMMLAEEEYSRITGRNLNNDLELGRVGDIRRAFAGSGKATTWQALQKNKDKFNQILSRNLNRYQDSGEIIDLPPEGGTIAATNRLKAAQIASNKATVDLNEATAKLTNQQPRKVQTTGGTPYSWSAGAAPQKPMATPLYGSSVEEIEKPNNSFYNLEEKAKKVEEAEAEATDSFLESTANFGRAVAKGVTDVFKGGSLFGSVMKSAIQDDAAEIDRKNEAVFAKKEFYTNLPAEDIKPITYDELYQGEAEFSTTREEAVRKTNNKLANHTRRLKEALDANMDLLTPEEKEIASYVLQGEEVELDQEVSTQLSKVFNIIESYTGTKYELDQNVGTYNNILSGVLKVIGESKNNRRSSEEIKKDATDYLVVLKKQEGLTQDDLEKIADIESMVDETMVVGGGNDQLVRSWMTGTVDKLFGTGEALLKGVKANMFQDAVFNLTREDIESVDKDAAADVLTTALQEPRSEFTGGISEEVVDKGDKRLVIKDGQVVDIRRVKDNSKVFYPSEQDIALANSYDSKKDKTRKDYRGKVITSLAGQVAMDMVPMMAISAATGGTTLGTMAGSMAVSYGGYYKQGLEQTGDMKKATLFAAMVAPSIGYVESKIGNIESRLGRTISGAERQGIYNVINNTALDAAEAGIETYVKGPGFVTNLKRGVEKTVEFGNDLKGELAEEFTNFPVEALAGNLSGVKIDDFTYEKFEETMILTPLASGPMSIANMTLNAKNDLNELIGFAAKNKEAFYKVADQWVEAAPNETEKQKRSRDVAAKKQAVSEVEDTFKFIEENNFDDKAKDQLTELSLDKARAMYKLSTSESAKTKAIVEKEIADINTKMAGIKPKPEVIEDQPAVTKTFVGRDITDGMKVYVDFDNTLYDPKTGELTAVGKELRDKLDSGELTAEDAEILTARDAEQAKEIAKFFPELTTKSGLSPEAKSAEVAKSNGNSLFIDDNKENLKATTTGEVIDSATVVPQVPKEVVAEKVAAETKTSNTNDEIVDVAPEDVTTPTETQVNETPTEVVAAKERIKSQAKNEIDSILSNDNLTEQQQDEAIAEIVKQAKVQIGFVDKAPELPSVRFETPELVLTTKENPFKKSLVDLGYSDEQISGLTLDQQQGIVINKTTAPEVVDTAKVDSIKENSRQERIAEMQKELNDVVTENASQATQNTQPTQSTTPTEKAAPTQSKQATEPSNTVTTTLPGGNAEKTYVKQDGKWFVGKKDGTASKTEVKKPEYVAALDSVQENSQFMEREQGVESEQVGIEAKKADIEKRRQEELTKIIQSIFPNTQLNEIVYHGTRTQDKFDTFDETKIGELDSGYFGRGFYFSPDKSYAEGYSKQYNGYTIAAILNLQNPLETDANKANTNISLEKNDGAIVRVGENLSPELNTTEYDANEIGEVVVKNSNQIHILSEKELSNIDKINAKYDAELKALEQQAPTQNDGKTEQLPNIPAQEDLITELEQLEVEYDNATPERQAAITDRFNQIIKAGDIKFSGSGKPNFRGAIAALQQKAAETTSTNTKKTVLESLGKTRKEITDQIKKFFTDTIKDISPEQATKLAEANFTMWEAVANTLNGSKGLQAAIDYMRSKVAQIGVIATVDEARTMGNSKFQILGEKGATALDAAEEATTRLDNLAVAKEMEAAGKDAIAIRLATGWEKNTKTNKWQYEVQDDITVNSEVFNKVDKDGYYITKLSDLFNLPELFTTYPELKDIRVVIAPTNKNPLIGMSVGTPTDGIKTLFIYADNYLQRESGGSYKFTSDGALSKFTSDSLHELQHLAGNIEGFHRGGNFNDARGEIEKDIQRLRGTVQGQDLERRYKEDAFGVEIEYYERIAGEVEARNVSKRMDYTPEQRRQTLLQETEDVDREDQIILQDGIEGLASAINEGSVKFSAAEQDLAMVKATNEADKITLKYNDKGQHLAPNGKPSNLTESQAKIVRTPAFKNWFGDWENDPKNASKVVDSNGEPMVVYHGTDASFTEFDINKKGSNTKAPDTKLGFFFAETNESAKLYGDNVLPVFLNIRSIKESQNLVEYYNQENLVNTLKYYTNNFGDTKENLGDWISSYFALPKDYSETDLKGRLSKEEDVLSKMNRPPNINETDGLKTPMFKSKDKSQYIAFNPNQVKLADGTNQTFNPNTNDIRFSAAENQNQATPQMANRIVNNAIEHLKELNKKGLEALRAEKDPKKKDDIRKTIVENNKVIAHIVKAKKDPKFSVDNPLQTKFTKPLIDSLITHLRSKGDDFSIEIFEAIKKGEDIDTGNFELDEILNDKGGEITFGDVINILKATSSTYEGATTKEILGKLNSIGDPNIGRIVKESIKFSEGETYRGVAIALASGQNIVAALESPAPTTFAHEAIFHSTIEPFLETDAEAKQTFIDEYNDQFGTDKKDWDTNISERTARVYEKYLSKGRKLGEEDVKDEDRRNILQRAFDAFTELMKDIIISYKGKNIEVSPAAQAYFDKITGITPTQKTDSTGETEADNIYENTPIQNIKDGSPLLDTTKYKTSGKLTNDDINKSLVDMGLFGFTETNSQSFKEAVNIAANKGYLSEDLTAETIVRDDVLIGKGINSYQEIALQRAMANLYANIELTQNFINQSIANGDTNTELSEQKKADLIEQYELFALAYQKVGTEYGRGLVYRRLAQAEDFNPIVLKERLSNEFKNLDPKFVEEMHDLVDKIDSKRKELIELSSKVEAEKKRLTEERAKDGLANIRSDKSKPQKDPVIDFQTFFSSAITPPTVKFSGPTGNTSSTDGSYTEEAKLNVVRDFARYLVKAEGIKDLPKLTERILEEFEKVRVPNSVGLSADDIYKALALSSKKEVANKITEYQKNISSIRSMANRFYKLSSKINGIIPEKGTKRPALKDLEELDKLNRELQKIFIVNYEDFGFDPNTSNDIVDDLEQISEAMRLLSIAKSAEDSNTQALRIRDLIGKVNGQMKVDRLEKKLAELRDGKLVDTKVSSVNSLIDAKMFKLKEDIDDARAELKNKKFEAKAWQELEDRYGTKRAFGVRKTVLSYNWNSFKRNFYEYSRRYVLGGDIGTLALQGGYNLITSIGGVVPQALTKDGRVRLKNDWRTVGEFWAESFKGLYKQFAYAINKNKYGGEDPAVVAYQEMMHTNSGVFAKQMGLALNRPFAAQIAKNQDDFFANKGLADMKADSKVMKGVINIIEGFEKVSEGAYTMGMNSLRLNLFNAFKDANIGRELTIEELKQWANHVNTMTGTSTKAPNGLEQASKILLAPKLYVSRMKLIVDAPRALNDLRTPEKRLVAKERLKMNVKFVTGFAMIMAAMALLGWEFEDDPRDSDFLKFKKGRKTWDLTAGIGKWASLLVSIPAEVDRAYNKGGVGDWWAGDHINLIKLINGDKDWIDLKASKNVDMMDEFNSYKGLENVFQSKLVGSLHPTIKTGLSLFEGEDAVGQPLGTTPFNRWYNFTINSMAPLSMQDLFLKENTIMKYDPADLKAKESALKDFYSENTPQFFGLNVSDPDNNMKHILVEDFVNRNNIPVGDMFKTTQVYGLIPELKTTYSEDRNIDKLSITKMFKKEVIHATGSDILQNIIDNNGVGTLTKGDIENLFSKNGEMVRDKYVEYYKGYIEEWNKEMMEEALKQSEPK